MVKNLKISSVKNVRMNKTLIHNIVSLIKTEMNFKISSLEINFVNEELILEINIKYLDHNFTTDIITFNYSGENDNLDGEIFISVPDAASNAKKYKCHINAELLRLIVHGILHLLGFDDMTKEDKKEMKKNEDKLVKLFREKAEKEKVIYENKNS